MAGILGIDLGGTNLKFCIRRGHEVGSVNALPTPQDEASLIRDLQYVLDIVRYSKSMVDRVGVGLPGLVGPDGIAQFLPHLPGLNGLDLKAVCEEALGAPVRLDNDANCAGVAELQCIGSCKSGYELVLGIGTGLGAALFGPHGIVRGTSGFAGEVGHVCIDKVGRFCPCGKRGCWERYCSASSLRSDLNEAGYFAFPVEGVFSQRAENSFFERLVEEMCANLGLGIANLVAILDLERVVLTGGLARGVAEVLPRVREHFSALVEGGGVRVQTEIRTGSLFESAGAIGATYLWD